MPVVTGSGNSAAEVTLFLVTFAALGLDKARVLLGRATRRWTSAELTHRTLLEAVWGEASQEQPEYLRVFMGQLRKKLEPDPSNPRYLVTEPWVGYRFNPNG